MKPEHKELIERYRDIKKQIKSDDCSLISWVFRDSPTKKFDALSLPPERRKCIADSYREVYTGNDLASLRKKRVDFVREWKACRYFKRVLCTVLIPVFVAVILNGVERENGSWDFCSENMIDRRMLWLVILLLAALTIPIKGSLFRFFSKRVDGLFIFSFLLIIVCLLELVALF